jgi:hypothetical protein
MIRSLVVLLFLTLSMLPIQGCLRGDSSSSASSGSGSTFAGAISAQNKNGTEILVNWNSDNSASVTGYEIYQTSTDDSISLVGTANSVSTSYTASNLSPGHLHSFIVRAIYNDGTIDSNSVIVSSLAYAGIVSFRYRDTTSVDLDFPASVDASEIKIYCGENADSMAPVHTALKTDYTYRLQGLDSNKQYHCKVKAVNSGGKEDNNTAILAFTPQMPPADPFGFSGITSAENSDGNSAWVYWSKANPSANGGVNISKYKITVFDSDGLYIQEQDVEYQAAINTYNALVENLAAGKDYFFNVRALDLNSLTDGNTLQKSAFTYAGIKSAASTSSATAIVEFPAAESAAELRVYCYKTSDGPSTSPITTLNTNLGTTTSTIITGLSSGTNYTCFVKAVSAFTTLEDSNIVTKSFTTP